MIPGADPRRLEKARKLIVEEVEGGEPREYLVTDRTPRHEFQYYVDLGAETPCHCDDATRTVPAPVACKHVLACMLYERREQACNRPVMIGGKEWPCMQDAGHEGECDPDPPGLWPITLTLYK